MAQAITIPNGALIVPLNLSSISKTVILPIASTNSGRILILKDLYGNSANSTILVSTMALDRIESSNITNMRLSNNYGAWWFTNDGINKWFLTDAYLNSFTLITSSGSGLPLVPAARYSFLSTNYSGSGAASNIGSNSAVGTATISLASYTSTSPGFISLGNYTSTYILSPSVSNIQTLVMIARVKTGNTGYTLDARTALGNGYIYTTAGGIGADWTSGGTYYKDTVLTSISLAGSDNLTDNQWHHLVYQRAAWTGAVTFLARFSLNESAFADCGEVMIFTQALTLQQIKDNFNFFASRFGWTPVS